jgi:hypothetical protein
MNKKGIILGSILMVVIIAYFTSSFYVSKNTRLEIVKIGQDLIKLDSISDFLSNKNYPVNNVENIGEGLYKILRSKKALGKNGYNYTVKKGDWIQRNVSRKHLVKPLADYTLIIKSKNKTLSIRLKYHWKNKYYKILGYSGTL